MRSREGREELRGVKEGEALTRIYCMGKESIFKKVGRKQIL